MHSFYQKAPSDPELEKLLSKIHHFQAFPSLRNKIKKINGELPDAHTDEDDMFSCWQNIILFFFSYSLLMCTMGYHGKQKESSFIDIIMSIVSCLNFLAVMTHRHPFFVSSKDYAQWHEQIKNKLAMLDQKFESLSDEQKRILANKNLAEEDAAKKFSLKFKDVTWDFIAHPVKLIVRKEGQIVSETHDLNTLYRFLENSESMISPLSLNPFVSCHFSYSLTMQYQQYILELDSEIKKLDVEKGYQKNISYAVKL